MQRHCSYSVHDLAPKRHDNVIVTKLFPLQFVLATFVGWANRHHAQVIEYLAEKPS